MNKSKKIAEFILLNGLAWIIESFILQIMIYMVTWYMLKFSVCMVLTSMLWGLFLVASYAAIATLATIRSIFGILIQFRSPFDKNGKPRLPFKISKV